MTKTDFILGIIAIGATLLVISYFRTSTKTGQLPAINQQLPIGKGWEPTITNIATSSPLQASKTIPNTNYSPIQTGNPQAQKVCFANGTCY